MQQGLTHAAMAKHGSTQKRLIKTNDLLQVSFSPFHQMSTNHLCAPLLLLLSSQGSTDPLPCARLSSVSFAVSVTSVSWGPWISSSPLVSICLLIYHNSTRAPFFWPPSAFLAVTVSGAHICIMRNYILPGFNTLLHKCCQ